TINTRFDWRQALVAVLGLFALAATWLYLAPAGLGGPVTYVATYGTSMEPKLHTGDMVLVREHGDYHVGQVVAYRSHELGPIAIPLPGSRTARAAAAVSGASLLGFGLLAAVAWSHSDTRSLSSPVNYGQAGVFGYRATAAGGSVYPGGLVAPGQPVFLRLVKNV